MAEVIRPTATATLPAGAVVNTKPGSRISLDEAWSPYASGLVTVPFTGDEDLDALDPRAAQRIKITATEDFAVPAGMTRTFDLALRTRTIDHKQRTIDLELASDEAFLFDMKRLSKTADTGARAYESSVRGICEWAIGQIPSIIRNLDVNPSAKSGGSTAALVGRYGWTVVLSTSASAPAELPFVTIARATSVETGTLAFRGFDSYGGTGAATPGVSGVWAAGPEVTAGATLTVSRYVRGSMADESWAVGVRFHDGAGNWVTPTIAGSAAPNPSGWARPSVTVTVPAGAKYIAVSTYMTAAVAITTSTFCDITGLLMEYTDTVRSWREKILEPGTWDADATAQWDATNLIPNPNLATAITSWAASWNCTLAHNTGAGVSGVGFARATQTASPHTVNMNTARTPVSPGEMFTASVYVRSNAVAGLGRILFQYYSPEDAIIRTVSAGYTTLPAGAWTRLTFTSTVPSDAASMLILVSYEGGGAGTIVDYDQAMLTEGPIFYPYFDGNSPNTAGYTYSWEGTANLSSSLRIASPERLPELFDWKPGQALWDFLTPFLEMAGLRLFCDEQRLWRLVLTSEYQVLNGSVVALGGENTGPNTVEGVDVISRDREDWATGVVVEFRYTDSKGIERTAYDVAGTSEKVITIVRETAPTPGAAVTILNHFKARGSTQDMTVMGQLIATPAGTATIRQPDMIRLVGKIASVSFDLYEGTTSFTTRDMEEAPL